MKKASWVRNVILLMAAARGTIGSAKPPAKPCRAPEYRQFDFWVGDWNVEEKGKPAGTNKVESILDGCIVRENWVGTGGSEGTSLNRYDPAVKRWHQTWVDNDGGKLELTGELREGKMVLGGSRPSAKDPKLTIVDRISWQKLPDGRVHQLWEASRDGEKNWQVQFDGYYTKKR